MIKTLYVFENKGLSKITLEPFQTTKRPVCTKTEIAQKKKREKRKRLALQQGLAGCKGCTKCSSIYPCALICLSLCALLYLCCLFSIFFLGYKKSVLIYRASNNLKKALPVHARAAVYIFLACVFVMCERLATKTMPKKIGSTYIVRK